MRNGANRGRGGSEVGCKANARREEDLELDMVRVGYCNGWRLEIGSPGMVHGRSANPRSARHPEPDAV